MHKSYTCDSAVTLKDNKNNINGYINYKNFIMHINCMSEKVPYFSSFSTIICLKQK